MRQPFIVFRRRGVWYYRLAGETFGRSTGQRGAKGGAVSWVLEHVAGAKRVPGAGRRTLREYTAPFFRPDTDPRASRKRDEGRPVGLEHLRNSRRWLEMYVHKDAIADRPLAEISRADLLAFRARLVRKCGAKRNTVNKVMATLKTVLKEAVYLQDIPADPTVGIGSIHETRATPGTLTAAELRALFPAGELGPWPDLRARLAYLLAATTGMRRGELLALRWRDVDLEAAVLRVERAWKRRERAEGAPKSGKTREVPLPAATVKGLTELRAASKAAGPDDLVLCYDDGGRMGETWWRKRFHRAIEKAEIATAGRRLVPHSLRHSLATLLAAEEYDPEKLRAALGWADEGIRRNYTHLAAEHMRGQAAIVDRLLDGAPTADPRTSHTASPSPGAPSGTEGTSSTEGTRRLLG